MGRDRGSRGSRGKFRLEVYKRVWNRNLQIRRTTYQN